MSLCVASGGVLLAKIVAAAFTLSWTHSVEKVEWREDWRVTPKGLTLVEAAVKGSGAGMEPGENAVLRDGWYVWRPDGAPLPELVLSASGATGGGWTLCHAEGCMALGQAAGESLRIAPCDGP